MAVVSTSLVSQLSGSKSAMSSSSSPPQFSGLRRFSHNLKLDQSHSLSSTVFFFQQVHSHLRLSAGRPSCRGVVTMGASGKFFVGGNWKCVLMLVGTCCCGDTHILAVEYYLSNNLPDAWKEEAFDYCSMEDMGWPLDMEDMGWPLDHVIEEISSITILNFCPQFSGEVASELIQSFMKL